MELLVRATGAFLLLHGAAPTTSFLLGSLETRESGCLVVDREFQTSVRGVYAVGDVICEHMKQAVASAAEGCIAAFAAEKLLRGRAHAVVDYR